MEVTMRLPSDMLFVPRWLDNINPCAASTLTARIITPLPYNRVQEGRVKMVFGQTTVTGIIVPKEDQLAVQANIESNREERKAKRRQEMNSAGNMDRMTARAERRAAKEAKRIMEKRRQQIIATFTEEDA